MNTKPILQIGRAGCILLLSLALGRLHSTAMAQALPGPKSGPPPGYRLVEGDIQVPIPPGGEIVAAGTFANSGDLWPGGDVPYEFDDNVSAENRQRMLDAMAVWQNVANIRFRPKNWWELIYYVHIQDNDSSNDSPVGRQFAGNTINIVSWGSTYIMAHELAHTLGFWHEQSRLDRDSYVQINWGNIQSGLGYNFQKENHSNHYGPYDFDSVMHYGACSFSMCSPCSRTDNSCRTITVLPPYDTEWQTNIGQRSHLSEWDARIMSFLYPNPDWRFVDQAAGNSTCSGIGAPDGTFLDPYNSFFCGVYNVPNGGTIWIQPGTYPGVGTYGTGAANKAMTWRAPLGGVTLH